MSYDEDYWEEYQRRDSTDIGKQLTDSRVSLVRKYTNIAPVDIGIGGGAFVKSADCFGFDVNQKAIDWLKSENRYKDPYGQELVDAITCWDSLEHILEPEKLINKVKGYVFVSIPIYKDGAHVLKSKHFKPGEHVWYHSNNGLIDWMESLGFECLENNHMESELGREGIESYVFKRK